MTIVLKRAYEAPQKEDGFRVLIDRLWPRGISKDAAKIDYWAKDITPSTELRKWFAHDPLKYGEFKNRYIQELDNNHVAMQEFTALLQKHNKTTFVYGAKDTKHSHATILKEYVEQKTKQ